MRAIWPLLSMMLLGGAGISTGPAWAQTSAAPQGLIALSAPVEGRLILTEPRWRLAAGAPMVRLSYDRVWPATVSLSAGNYAVDLSPHANLALSNDGQSAAAGAGFQVRLRGAVSDAMGRMGLSVSPPPPETQRGRWFLFGESSGQVVGLNMSRADHGFMPHTDLSLEGGGQPTVISDAQAGVGWRRGAMQASFGYVHREIKNQAAKVLSRDPGDIKGDMVALTFSFRPR
ncbi:MAG: DUF2219 family protein [Caulobacteraceae bacterium]|nr:DUF2219 family protein [Caulobacteraceae bacterium]